MLIVFFDFQAARTSVIGASSVDVGEVDLCQEAGFTSALVDFTVEVSSAVAVVVVVEC